MKYIQSVYPCLVAIPHCWRNMILSTMSVGESSCEINHVQCNFWLCDFSANNGWFQVDSSNHWFTDSLFFIGYQQWWLTNLLVNNWTFSCQWWSLPSLMQCLCYVMPSTCYFIVSTVTHDLPLLKNASRVCLGLVLFPCHSVESERWALCQPRVPWWSGGRAGESRDRGWWRRRMVMINKWWING